MATQLTPEEAIERARRLQDDRLTAVRTVAEARQSLNDVRDETARELADLQARIAERIATAEREDVRAYSAALNAGWSADELRKIGFAEPDKKARTRRRSTRKPASSSAPAAADDASLEPSTEGWSLPRSRPHVPLCGVGLSCVPALRGCTPLPIPSRALRVPSGEPYGLPLTGSPLRARRQVFRESRHLGVPPNCLLSSDTQQGIGIER